MSSVASRLSSWFKDDTLVTILLTDDGTKYTLSKKTVCSISDYFAKALDGDFREAHERTLKLPDCSEETFDAVLWFHMNSSLPWDIESGDQAQLLLVNLWIFGDIYLLPRLKKETFTAASEMLERRRPCPGILAEVFARCAEDSPLRALVIEKATSCIARRAYSSRERAELAEIEEFSEIMADGVAVEKSSRAIASTVAQERSSNSPSPTNTGAPDRIHIESTAPKITTTVPPTSMPTSTSVQAGPSALNPAASADAELQAKREKFQKAIARNLLIQKQECGR
ncbi:hypothetical protein D0860_03439 [Hortaea werneckii]|uniref:Uncharacterized protein n=1 Tax=Hortaea werneckii TaxID=91943 RepID=A0A3M7HDF1_HORWE|nr:hypothetical protein D0860_03439 [Hortaea werneckii]